MPTDVLETAFAVSGVNQLLSAFKSVQAGAFDVSLAFTALGAAAGTLAGLAVAAVNVSARFQHLASDASPALVQFAKELAQSTGGAGKSIEELIQAGDRLQDLGLDPYALLQPLAAASADTGADMERLATVLGKIHQLGTVTARDLTMMLRAGLPAGDLLNKSLGITVQQFRDLKDGAMDADTFINNFGAALSQAFDPTVQRQAGDLTNTVSRLNATWQDLQDTFAQPILPLVTDDVGSLNNQLFSAHDLAADLGGAFAGAMTVAQDAVMGVVHGVKTLYDGLMTVVSAVGTLGSEFAAGASLPASWIGKAMEKLGIPGGNALAGLPDMFNRITARGARDTKQYAAATVDESKGLFNPFASLMHASEVMDRAAADMVRNRYFPASYGGAMRTPVAPAAAAKQDENQVDKVVAEFLYGGGPRGKRAAHGIDAEFGLTRGPAQIPPIHVVIDNPGKGVDAEVTKRAQQIAQDTVTTLLRKGYLVAPARG